MSLKSTSKIETNKYELEIEVSAADFNTAIDAAYKKEVKNIQVAGFRKGKAPKNLIEKTYGDKVFFDAAIEALYRPTVSKAIDESELEVVSVGEMDIIDASKENGLVFKVAVVVKPEVSIDGYKGIEVEKEEVNITDEDIEAEINKTLDRNSRMVSVDDRAALTGDTATIDFEGFVDDVAFEGGKGEGHELALGAGQFIPGFEDQIVGHEIGDAFDVNVTFPEEYHAEELKGKAAVFKVKLHAIKRKELPAFDDELVKDISDFETVAEYKADVKEKLETAKKAEVDAQADNTLIDTIVEKLEGEIPNEMYESEINESINNFAYRLQSQGLNVETYMQYTNMTPDTLRDQFRAQAEKNVKVRLALEKIVELENIDATDAEIDAEYEKLAGMYNVEVDQVKAMVLPEQLKGDVTNQKAVEFIRENAVIKTK